MTAPYAPLGQYRVLRQTGHMTSDPAGDFADSASAAAEADRLAAAGGAARVVNQIGTTCHIGGQGAPTRQRNAIAVTTIAQLAYDGDHRKPKQQKNPNAKPHRKQS